MSIVKEYIAAILMLFGLPQHQTKLDMYWTDTGFNWHYHQIY